MYKSYRNNAGLSARSINVVTKDQIGPNPDVGGVGKVISSKVTNDNIQGRIIPRNLCKSAKGTGVEEGDDSGKDVSQLATKAKEIWFTVIYYNNSDNNKLDLRLCSAQI